MRKGDIQLRVEFRVSNRSYGRAWLAKLQAQSPHQLAIIQAILDAICRNDGGDFTQREILASSAEVAAYLREQRFSVVPSGGLELAHNGLGIRHAKYSPSKNIAILWERIGDTVFYTFDDHAPIRFYRAIFHLRHLRLGRRAWPSRQRQSRRFIERLKTRRLRRRTKMMFRKHFFTY